MRNSATGPYKLFHLEHGGGNLVTAAGVDVGQLPVRPGSGRVGTGAWDYYLEYQRPVGWNRGIPSPRLVIRRRVGNTAAYLGEVIAPTIMGGKASWIEPAGKVRFEVEKVRDDERVISVFVTKVQ